MNSTGHALMEAFRAEYIQLKRSPLLISLTVIQAITFIFLVNFFGMSGAFAPTAIIDNDKGYYAKVFIESLQQAHHAFTLIPMDKKSAIAAVHQGKIVAMITIPKEFSKKIAKKETVAIKVIVDNLDTDMTADIQRALPSAIAKFGHRLNLPGITVETQEVDIIDHDTGFIPYLVTSALALIALIIAGILGAITVAREFESKTIDLLHISPVHPIVPILGRLLATNLVADLTMVIAVGIVIFGHGILPIHPVELVITLLFCVFIFGLLGAALGAIMQRTLPVASVIFGISLPLYLFSGAYEPERFDGNTIWAIAHTTPLYYAVGILEHAMLNLQVTPESIFVNFLALGGWAILALTTTWYCIRRNTQ